MKVCGYKNLDDDVFSSYAERQLPDVLSVYEVRICLEVRKAAMK